VAGLVELVPFFPLADDIALAEFPAPSISAFLSPSGYRPILFFFSAFFQKVPAFGLFPQDVVSLLPFFGR